MEGVVDLIEKLCHVMEAVNGFCYLKVRIYASGGCESKSDSKSKNWLGKTQGM